MDDVSQLRLLNTYRASDSMMKGNQEPALIHHGVSRTSDTMMTGNQEPALIHHGVSRTKITQGHFHVRSGKTWARSKVKGYWG